MRTKAALVNFVTVLLAFSVILCVTTSYAEQTPVKPTPWDQELNRLRFLTKIAATDPSTLNQPMVTPNLANLADKAKIDTSNCGKL